MVKSLVSWPLRDCLRYKMNKKKMLVLVLMSGLFLKPCWGLAYTDNILASKEEVWDAAVEVMAEKGIESKDFEKGKIKSKWVEDLVVRRNKLAKSILKATYKRRSRYQVFIEEMGVETVLQVKGSYQFKPSNTDFRVLWKTLKPSYDDRLTEQEIFYDVLKAMGDKKLKKESSS